MKRMLTLAATVVLAYAVILLLIYAMQDRLVYFPLRDLAATPRTIGLDYEDVRISTEDGVRLHGWFVPTLSARATIVHFHGNAGNISHRLERIALFRRLAANVFLFDYRGYGQSEGRPGEQGTYRDARAVWRYLTETRGLAPAGIVLHGESLGGAVAAWLAAQITPGGLILESSFTSATDLGAEVYPWLPVRWLARYRYPTIEYLAQGRAPVLVIHSREDEIIPFQHGQKLHAAAADPKWFLEIRGGHNDGLWVNDAQYLAGIEAFLETLYAGSR